jgi:SAM-dependent methyltransferase
MATRFEPRFGQAAEAFNAYRPEYPAEIFQHILAHVPPRRHRAMDLGAGTGRATHNLASHFNEVIAVEPDLGMAEKLRAVEPRAVVRITTAEDCVQPPASVDLVVIANALHWMDGPAVMKNIVRWLLPCGILAWIDPPFPRMTSPIRPIIRGEFDGHWNAFRAPRLGKAGNRREHVWQDLITSTLGLRLFDEKTFESKIDMTAADFTGFWRSTSYGSAYARSLDDPDAYWSDLESRLRMAWPEEKFPVDFSPLVLLAKKE